MARWKPIDSAPEGRPILVDGGTWDGEIHGHEPADEPIKVIRRGAEFSVCDTDVYSAWVRNPKFWTDLPERHISLALPRPATEYDL